MIGLENCHPWRTNQSVIQRFILLRFRRQLSFLAMFLVLCPNAVFGWSEGGHRIIALLAYDLLSKEEQARFQELLSSHPRFEIDFTAPEKLPNDEEVARWRVGRAGYWPDVARKQPTYNRPNWHYELGSTKSVGDLSKLKVPAFPGPLPTVANLETQELYASQAIALCRKVLTDSSSVAGDRAIALSWLGHLVADVHQPCHAGSLYMEEVFPEGDRGANSIKTKQRRNMHALWDGLLGEDFSLQGTRKRMAEIRGDLELVGLGTMAVSKPDSLDPQTWLSESRSIALESVYSAEVMAHLQLVTRGFTETPETLDLSETYLKNAGRVAQGRAIEAAHRLAAIWCEGL